MCKELPVIPVNKVVDPKKNNWKKWRAKEEERYKGLPTPPPKKKTPTDSLTVTPLRTYAALRCTYDGVLYAAPSAVSGLPPPLPWEIAEEAAQQVSIL
jgi:hypothetical protein